MNGEIGSGIVIRGPIWSSRASALSFSRETNMDINGRNMKGGNKNGNY